MSDLLFIGQCSGSRAISVRFDARIFNDLSLKLFRLGCPEGHVLCYECVYRMFLEPEKPSRGCPLCRHVLHRPPFLDRIFKGIADVVLPAYVPSDEDVLRKAPKNDGWVKKLLWPPTAAAARNIRHKIRRGTTNDEVIVIEESSSDESVIQLEF